MCVWGGGGGGGRGGLLSAYRIVGIAGANPTGLRGARGGVQWTPSSEHFG